jgi:hypothetical protein
MANLIVCHKEPVEIHAILKWPREIRVVHICLSMSLPEWTELLPFGS